MKKGLKPGFRSKGKGKAAKALNAHGAAMGMIMSSIFKRKKK